MTTATATKQKAASTTVKIPKAELLDALVAINHATPARPAKPILANCRIGDGIVTGTDLEVRIDRTIAEHCEPFLVPHARLLAIVRAATGDEVTLVAKGPSVTVRCGGGSWTLPTEDVAEYPTWEPGEMQAVCRLPADQFARAAKATTYATDCESSRYALGAVLIEVKGGNPTWVATDGRRLASRGHAVRQHVHIGDAVRRSKPAGGSGCKSHTGKGQPPTPPPNHARRTAMCDVKRWKGKMQVGY